MADIQIQRKHQLGLAGARKVAWKWAEQAEAEFDMSCTYEEGGDCDEVQFSRTGVKGSLKVTEDGAFKDRIEGEIVKNLDELLAAKKPASKSAAKKKKA
jgi:hypothetical protein